jgi:hypothetical protein
LSCCGPCRCGPCRCRRTVGITLVLLPLCVSNEKSSSGTAEL